MCTAKPTPTQPILARPPLNPDNLPMRPSPLLWLVLLAGCASNQPMQFSSAPPGATILIDGEDTGFVTPALLDVPDPDASQVSFVLPGYLPAVRGMSDERRGTWVFWRDAATPSRGWRFPLFLPAQDFFEFYKRPGAQRLENQVRGRIFVRLRRRNDT